MTARWLVLPLLVAVALAGCVRPGTGDGFDFEAALAGCEPGSGDDPYPQDRVFDQRNASLVDETLYMAGCLVNGADETYRDECGRPPGPTEIEVRRRSDDEIVFLRPRGSWPAVCENWTIPANAEWDEARFEIAWDLRKDVCRDDDDCREPDEGERIPGGLYDVRLHYVRFEGIEPIDGTVDVPEAPKD